jgi:DNA polymerase III delta prime subunit
MLKYCRDARMKYSNYLADKKTIDMRSAVEIKKSNIKGDIGKEKSAKIKLENAIERLEKEANELAQKAEREKKMSLFIESNTIRKRSLEYKQELEGTVSKLRKLEDQLSKV